MNKPINIQWKQHVATTKLYTNDSSYKLQFMKQGQKQKIFQSDSTIGFQLNNGKTKYSAPITSMQFSTADQI